MKRPTDRGLIRSFQRFSSPAVQWFSIALVASIIFNARVGAQLSPPDKNSARSISGQFIVTRPDQAPQLHLPARIATSTNLVRLEPALLAVSAERIKELLWRRLDIKGQWRGQIYLALHRAQSPDEGVTIRSQYFTGGWIYRVDLPDALPPTRFAQALTGVLLLEYANRTAQSRSAEIPAWLTDGLSQQLLAAGSPEFLLSTPDKLVNSLPVTRLEKTQHGLDALADARRVLKNHPALTFEELSWPTGAELDAADGGAYRASAQLFVSEVLGLKNGPAHLRTLLESLPRFYNAQVAFQSAFREEFPRPLDLEKWWALQVVDFAAGERGPGWTLAVSREKLDEILRVSVAVRTASNSLPVHSEISLQAVIRGMEPERQATILQTKLRDLDLAQLRIARPYAVLTAEYRRAIGSYLGQRPAGASSPSWATRVYRSLRKPSAASTIKKLDELDARRRSIEAVVQPEKSVQPVINH